MRTTFAKLHFINRPHGALDVFHPGKTLVEGQVVADGVLQDKTKRKSIGCQDEPIVSYRLNDTNKNTTKRELGTGSLHI